MSNLSIEVQQTVKTLVHQQTPPGATTEEGVEGKKSQRRVVGREREREKKKARK